MASTSSSSSSTTPRWRYDVFLNFHGDDTRMSFTDHLHAALKQKGIIVFRDNEKLEGGKSICEELLKAIQQSMYAITVISPNYASSKWCLNELSKIVQCMRDTGLTILPIFYHVDPSDIRNQTGTFAEAFARHEASLRKKKRKVDIEMIQKWRTALREVGNISGWHVHDRPESKVVKDISGRILSGLGGNFSNVSKVFVGIESRVAEMMSLLSIGLDDVRFLGIYGMGGIGKTTLSKVIYERVSCQFEARCFIASIREETRTHGLVYLQKQLLSEILMESEINIWNDYGARSVIANRLRNKKVFIVLDDVDGEEQLKALAESHDWFGQGSRIIITSRDRHLLNRLVHDTYEVKELNNVEALQLFSWKAFKKPYPEENYVELSKDVVYYAQGLPLALEVFGSFLFGRPITAWKSARDLLKENPNAEILDKLKISFDGLEDLQKKLFLDIACFFTGAYIDTVMHKLESFGYYPNINIEVLADKSLITISTGRLLMHDLLQKMGQKIVHCESTEEPGGCSRLWRYDDVLHVLKNYTGTDAVKGIVLKLPLHKHERLNVEAFSKMKKLKMLEISNVVNFSPWLSKACDTLEWHGDPLNFMLSNELCVMKWWGYPLESLPISFQSDNLVELIMHYSFIKQPWDGRKSFNKLKHIDLSQSQNLIETPDFMGVPNLEKLVLVHCTSLSKVHSSIGFLRRLKELDLRDCKCLERLPDEISLESLEVLYLSGCSRLNKFPNIVGHMTSLREVYLTKTAIKNLPLSFKSLSSLVYLNISDCSRLKKIPKSLSGLECLEVLMANGAAIRKLLSFDVSLKKLKVLNVGGKWGSEPIISLLIPNSLLGLSSLEQLDLSYRNLSDGAIPNNDLSCLSSLSYLNLSGNKFTRMPDSFCQLPKLRILSLAYCSRLQLSSNPDNYLFSNSFLGLSSLRKLNLSYCNLLDGAIPNDLSCISSLHSLNLSGNKFTRIPDSVGQLSHLYELFLDDCSWLQVLPKLPLGFKYLRVKHCLSLEMFYNQMEMWTSNEKLRSIDCSFVAAYIDYDGKPFKILHMHPRSPLWINSNSQSFFYSTIVACGPALVEYGIPEWFNRKSRNSFGRIQMHTNLGSDEWKGYALFIVYQVHEDDSYPKKRRKLKVNENGNLNSTTLDSGNLNFPYFVCQFQANEVDLGKPLVLCDPRAPCVGPNGFWVYIPTEWFRRRSRNSLGGWGNLVASITTGSLNVEVKVCGARVVLEQSDASELYQVLNSVCPHGLDLESYENLFFHLDDSRLGLMVDGPIKANLMW